MTAGPQPIKIAILAMGGEGGGVLADWIVDLGEQNGFVAQTTSVPGVAQRTGATIYYVELFPREAAERERRAPVLALMPLPGDVDVVLASELMECGRAIQRGLVTPDRTTLVTSTHRIYAIAEKTAMGDGRVDGDALLAHARAAARRLVAFDMADAAERTGSVISAVLFGALAGTGVLPFARERFEATIARGGVGVAPSLKAFEMAHAIAAGAIEAPVGERPVEGSLSAPASTALDGTTEAPPAPHPDPLPAGEREESPLSRLRERAGVRAAPDANLHPAARRIVDRIETEIPAESRPLVREGARRLVDYQDPAYAELYLDRLAAVAKAAPASSGLLDETARHLALWMSYEDTARVAQLKTRGARFDRVRADVRAAPGQVLAIDEYLHPRVQEIAETLPASIGRILERPGFARRVVERATRRGRVVTTSSLGGFVLLRVAASMRRWRRTTTRYAVENAAIEDWLQRIVAASRRDAGLAVEVARCQRLVKGYSDTHERGSRNFQAVMAALVRGGESIAPSTVRELRDAALADEHGHSLRAALERHALA